jgi:hypothetical protein
MINCGYINDDKSYYLTTKYKSTVMDEQRVQAFVQAKYQQSEAISEDVNVEDLLFRATSMHEVICTRSNNNCEFICDCKMYLTTGYVCSHILCHMHFLKICNVITMTAPVRERARPGRKARRMSALDMQKDVSPESRLNNPELPKAQVQDLLMHPEFGMGYIEAHLYNLNPVLWRCVFPHCQSTCKACGSGSKVPHQHLFLGTSAMLSLKENFHMYTESLYA